MPKINVIIPTRDRAGTLHDCLKTCVEQSDPDLKIIVSDNFSQDNTREVVEEFSDPRIEYINPGRRISMTANWEFALGHVKTGYVTILGDDDGLLPNAVSELSGLLEETNTDAVCWLKAEYHWPNHPESHRRNLLMIPTENVLFRFEARKAARDSFRLWLPYNRLPTLYNSMVSIDAIRRVGPEKFFHSVTPDVYSGFAILSWIDSYLYSTRPFSVNGASARSQGASFKQADVVDSETAKFLEENDLPQHEVYKLIPGCIFSSVAEAAAQASDHCFNGKHKVSSVFLLLALAREIKSLDTAARPEAIDKFRNLSDRLGRKKLGNWLLRWGRLETREEERADTGELTPDGISNGFFAVNCNVDEVSNINEAGQYVAKYLGGYEKPRKVEGHSLCTMLITRRYRKFELLSKLFGV